MKAGHTAAPRRYPRTATTPVALLSAALCAAALPPAPLHAAEDPAKGYPARPVRIVIGFTPGGVPDITARLIATKLTENLRQPVIVDNRVGAGGTIAAQIVASANPDGHTLLSVSSAHAAAPTIYPKLPYDTLKDFAGITMTASGPALLVVAPALGAKSARDLIALAKARPGQLNFSSAGVGSGTHFAAEQFRIMAGIDVVHVPFKGIPEALTETITGRVQFFISPLASALPLVRAGKALAVGVTSPRRSALLPEVPTVAESGLPGYQWEFWYGLLAPAATPRPLINRLNAEVTRILSLPETRKSWSALGADPMPTTPAEFDRLVASELVAMAKLAKVASIRAD
jgi:tripartite-type tricarboxylate transporter receptor subunit TctC